MRDLERYQDDYRQLPFEDTQSRFRRRKVREILGRLNARHILEAGCGMEPLFVSHAEFDSMHVVEPVESFAAHAQEASAGRANVAVHHGTLQAIAPALKGIRFDCIVMSSLLHEVELPAELLKFAAQLCNGDTVLHVNVPNARSLHRRLAVEMGLMKSVYDRTKTQVRMQQGASYDSESLHELLDRCGFAVTESGAYFLKPFAHAQMAELRNSGLLTDRLLDGLYTLGEQLPELASEIYANARLRK